MFTLKLINYRSNGTSKENYHYLGEDFSVDNINASEIYAVVSGSGNEYEVGFFEEAYIINDRGQTVKIVNRPSIKKVNDYA